ncbi:MAG: glycosyltransferase family 4 protein [Gammaproteobacteria bacterium]
MRAAFGVLGGTDSYLMPKYVAQRHDVLVLCQGNPKSGEEVVYKNDDLNICDVGAGSAENRVAKIFGALQKFKPEIVHVFHSRYCLRILYGLHRLPRVSRIIDFRSPLLVNGNVARAAVLCRYFLCQFYVDHVFTHSLGTIKDNLPLRFRRITELPPGVETLHFKSAGRPADTPRRFVYIGSVSKIRQLELLIRAFARFSRNNGVRPCLDIIGGGNALGELRNLVECDGLRDCIRLTGPVLQKEIYVLLREYDAGIAYVPYDKFSRAPSLKVLEYSAAGLPFMASDTIGHMDYASRFGFSFTPFQNSQEGIVAGLNRICAKPDLDDDVAVNRTAVQRFDWEHIVANDLLPVYAKLGQDRL